MAGPAGSAFLLKSELGGPVLGQIWGLADVGAKGWLTPDESFLAFKLVALAQAGYEPTVANVVAGVTSVLPDMHDDDLLDDALDL